jgi:hypothetical protein
MCQNVCVKCVCYPNVLLRRAQFYSPALRCAVRSIVQPPAQFLGPRAAEQPVLQRLETLQKVCALQKRYRRCARLLLSAQRIYIKLYSPPSLRSIVRSIAQCPARRGSIVRSIAVPSATSRARKCPTCAMRPYSAQHSTVHR